MQTVYLFKSVDYYYFIPSSDFIKNMSYFFSFVKSLCSLLESYDDLIHFLCQHNFNLAQNIFALLQHTNTLSL